MKSAICRLCNKDFRSEHFHMGTGGALVQFADFTPPPGDAGGQPRGMEWFCIEHLEAARKLAHLSSSSALVELQARFDEFPPWEEKPMADPALWVTKVGPNPAKVFSILRRAASVSPAEAKKRISQTTFQVLTGWPEGLKPWQKALTEAGAFAEIRFP